MHDSPGSVVTQLCSGLQLYSAERRIITCDKRSALAGHASYTLLVSNRIQRIASDMLPSQLSATLVVEALYYLLVGNFDLNPTQ